ncbi:MAG: hypothetical protein QOG00_332 [Pyrinomonadaceae bacterium]|nr:hypothetical protein [Pyrinomonadaceae bacterium]
MKVSREQRWTRAFVLEAGDFELLCAQLNQWIPNLKFQIESKDKFKRDFSSKEELLNFEHPPNKDIRILRISGYSDKVSFFLIRFDKDSLKNIFMSLDGDEEAVMALSEIVDNRLAAMKPWYSLLASPVPWILLLLTPGILLFLWDLVRILTGRVSTQVIFGGFGSVYVWIIGLSGALVFLFLERLKLYIFPMGVFALGQGARRHKNMETIRTVVVVAFLISIISSIVVALVLPTK